MASTLVYGLLAALLMYLGVCALLWRGVRVAATRPDNGRARPMVSVLVAARNESANIGLCLQALSRQTYPRRLWQVIVVDDRSTDGTSRYAMRWKPSLPGFTLIRVAHLPEGRQGKKHALEAGIRKASGDVILVTDADCQPPPGWIETMAGRFKPGVDAVIGYSPIRSASSHLWARAVETDCIAAGVVAAAGVGLGSMITCSGRSLAYRRRLFTANGGYSGLHRSVSGDDDLLLHRLSRVGGAQLAFAAESAATVPAIGPDRIGSALSQRLRHLSAGRHYPRSVMGGYGLFFSLSLALWAGLLVGPFAEVPWIFCLGPFAIKLAVDSALLRGFARRVGQPLRWRYLPLWEAYYLVSGLLLSPVAAVVRSRWRG
jgi:cellulose synthase/poly-beta-1,6-N-acetylglucosamine synthase-like glycosyltransferase